MGFIAAFFDAVRQKKPDRSGLVDNRIIIFYISPKSLQVVKPGSATCHLKLLRKMSDE